MDFIYDLLETRRDQLERDYTSGQVSRDEYIAIRAELMAIFARVDALAELYYLVPIYSVSEEERCRAN